jgi:hypothetical protein
MCNYKAIYFTEFLFSQMYKIYRSKNSPPVWKKLDRRNKNLAIKKETWSSKKKRVHTNKNLAIQQKLGHATKKLDRANKKLDHVNKNLTMQTENLIVKTKKHDLENKKN